MIPSVGRIVHYTNLGDKDNRYPPETQAALIVKASLQRNIGAGLALEENTYEVWLCVFYRTGFFFMESPVSFSEKPLERGTWTWPPRV